MYILARPIRDKLFQYFLLQVDVSQKPQINTVLFFGKYITFKKIYII